MSTPPPASLGLAHRIGGWAAFLCAVHCLLWPAIVVALAVRGLAELPYVDVGMAGVSLVALLVVAPHERPGVRVGFVALWTLLAVGIFAEVREVSWGGALIVGASLALAGLHVFVLRARRRGELAP